MPRRNTFGQGRSHGNAERTVWKMRVVPAAYIKPTFRDGSFREELPGVDSNYLRADRPSRAR